MNVVKRIVAREGDKISYNANELYINDVFYNEVSSFGITSTDSIDENNYVLIGDSFDYSSDSRQYGYVSSKNIIGKASTYYNWALNVYNFFLKK